MRKILFRGKAINREEGRAYRTSYKNGDWVYGLVTKLYDERFELLPATMTNEYGISGIEVDHNTFGQYIGLTDKNGTKIFEGDIVTGMFDFGIGVNSICVFKDGAFGLLTVQHGIEHFNAFTSICNVEYEVIGNVFDNPKSLEGVRE